MHTALLWTFSISIRTWANLQQESCSPAPSKQTAPRLGPKEIAPEPHMGYEGQDAATSVWLGVQHGCLVHLLSGGDVLRKRVIQGWIGASVAFVELPAYNE